MRGRVMFQTDVQNDGTRPHFSNWPLRGQFPASAALLRGVLAAAVEKNAQGALHPQEKLHNG